MDGHWREPDPDLEAALRASQLHWYTEGRAGAPLVAPGRDLRGLNLRERILSGAQLQGADLRGALLDQANLVRSALDGAHLDGARLFGADASKASLVEASAVEIQAVRSTWVRARFSEANMQRAILESANLQSAEFIRCDLRYAVLRGAKLDGALLAAATLDKTDLSGATVDGAVLDPAAFASQPGANTAQGNPTFSMTAEPLQRGSQAALFESLVAETLRAANVGEVHLVGRPGVPDFVVVLPDDGYVAVEAKALVDPQAIEAASRHADVVVIPDEMEFVPREAIPVLPLNRLVDWFRTSAQRQRKGHGGLAFAMRELSRLRPWLAFARQHRHDPSFLSRVSVWIDTKVPLMLTGADRRLAELIPAQVGGASWARGVEWADVHLDELDRFESEVRRLWREGKPDVEQSERLARQGWQLENELAAKVADVAGRSPE